MRTIMPLNSQIIWRPHRDANVRIPPQKPSLAGAFGDRRTTKLDRRSLRERLERRGLTAVPGTRFKCRRTS